MSHLRPVATTRTAVPQHLLVADPSHFEVAYAINPWMDPSIPVDVALVRRQWESLVEAYEALGHRVDVLPAVAGLPDLVFAANGAVVVDGVALVSRFRHPVRAAEADAHEAWLSAAGLEIHRSRFHLEGQGDVLRVGEVLLAGHGFRTDVRAHADIAAVTGREVVSLELVDSRWYHLDVVLFPLGDTVAWFPEALAPAAQAVVRRRFPDALEVTRQDAEVMGCNSVCDGVHVVLPQQARQLARDVAARGFEPVPVDLSEFRKSGGGPKCCTLELGEFGQQPSAEAVA